MYIRKAIVASNFLLGTVSSKPIPVSSNPDSFRIYRYEFDDRYRVKQLYLEKVNKFGFKETMVINRNKIPRTLAKDGWKEVIVKPHGGVKRKK